METPKKNTQAQKDAQDLKSFREMLNADIVIMYQDGFVFYKDKGYSTIIPYEAFKDIILRAYTNDTNLSQIEISKAP